MGRAGKRGWRWALWPWAAFFVLGACDLSSPGLVTPDGGHPHVDAGASGAGGSVGPSSGGGVSMAGVAGVSTGSGGNPGMAGGGSGALGSGATSGGGGVSAGGDANGGGANGG